MMNRDFKDVPFAPSKPGLRNPKRRRLTAFASASSAADVPSVGQFQGEADPPASASASAPSAASAANAASAAPKSEAQKQLQQ